MSVRRVLVAVALAATAGCGSSGESRTLTPADAAFVTTAAGGALATIRAAELAQRRSSDPSVTWFARTVESDTKADLHALTSFAADAGVTLPQQPDAKYASGYAALERADAATFDTAYLADETVRTDDLRAAFANEIRGGGDRSIATYALDALPDFDNHRSIAAREKLALTDPAQHGELSKIR